MTVRGPSCALIVGPQKVLGVRSLLAPSDRSLVRTVHCSQLRTSGSFQLKDCASCAWTAFFAGMFCLLSNPTLPFQTMVLRCLLFSVFFFNFFLNLFIFNGRIIALQACVGFYQTSTGISHRLAHVPSHLNIPPASLPNPPLWVVTEPRCEFPES